MRVRSARMNTHLTSLAQDQVREYYTQRADLCFMHAPAVWDNKHSTSMKPVILH